MNSIEQLKYNSCLPENVLKYDPFTALENELSSALSLYWSTAARILHGSGVNLLDPPAGFFSLEKNFFSGLFLYSYHRASIPKSRRILYAAINQCLRGMVTGCDNLLDDEYKKTLETDLPEQGERIRSVVDIMVSDRVLFEILLKQTRHGDLTQEQVLSASSATFKALVKSGAQEASEESGIATILKPAEVLCSVHHYKTGILFQSPWAVPAVVENEKKERFSHLLDALYRIGMGCQIMDDMVDLYADAREKRHNYILSLIYHDADQSQWKWLKALSSSELRAEERSFLLQEFPRAKQAAIRAACNFLETGLSTLLADSHRFMVQPAISFMAKRIGADRFMSGKEK